MHTDEHGFIGEGLSGAARGRWRKVWGVIWPRMNADGRRFIWGRIELRCAGTVEKGLGSYLAADERRWTPIHWGRIEWRCAGTVEKSLGSYLATDAHR